MNSEEYERLKEAEKAHLRKVRALKQQLQEAKKKERLAETIEKLDTSELDEEFDRSLRAVQEKSLTADARFDMAMEALDQAEARERQRLEVERFEKDQQRTAAAELVRRLKEEVEGQSMPVERHSSQAQHGASALTDDPPTPPDASPQNAEDPSKTIGRRRSRPD
jgi:hypothetical protein